METYCGIILKGGEDEDCGVAFITDAGVETYSTQDDEEIMELVKEYRPRIIALNAPQEVVADKIFPGTVEEETPLDPETAKLFRSGEKELIDEGYSMLPQDMRNRRVLERAEFISNSVKRSGVGARIIESHPGLIAKKLEVTGDHHLEAYGLETEDIENVWEFDAVLLALTAKLFDEDMCEGDDIILPKKPE